MLTRFLGINVSSKDPERLARFYNEVLGVPILQPGHSGYDGVQLGFVKDAPSIFIWDENRWGKATEKPHLVFGCDNVEKTFAELKQRGVKLDPPITASWGGKELFVTDPDGNVTLLLEVPT